MLKNVYLAGGMRTPFGTMNGALASCTAAELGSVAIRAALKRAGVEGKDADHVHFGNVIGAGLGQNIARQASIGAGVPKDVGAITINKVCGSAMRAVIMASQTIQCGDAGLIICGGCESMTNAPYMLPKARAGYRMGHGKLVDAMINDGLWDVYTDKHMGTCGHQCAAEYGFTREAQDDYAIESFSRAIKAWKDGFFDGEIVPVEIKSRKGTTVFDRDENPDKFRGAEKLRSLPPAFGEGTTVTAGNASGINDGAAAVLVFDDEKKDALGIKPDARIIGYANAATDPDWFTIAPVEAVQKLCDKINVKPSDVDIYEINEAFAVVAMVAIKQLNLDHSTVNVAGGAVAVGHPLGATGGRIINTLVRALHRNKKKLGIATLCLGGGEADAIAIERCD